MGDLSLEVMWLSHDADHSPPSSATLTRMLPYLTMVGYSCFVYLIWPQLDKNRMQEKQRYLFLNTVWLHIFLHTWLILSVIYRVFYFLASAVKIAGLGI
jgi:hypothetical protein